MVRRLLLLSAIFLTGLSGIANATPREDMLAGISRCTVFADEKTFLDCVYGAAQPVREELGLPPAPQAQTRLVPSASAKTAALPVARPAPQQRGGLMSALFGSGKVEAQSQMTSYSFDRNGYFTVTLSNGQVWKQESEGGLAEWRQPASKYKVTIRSGAMGSSNLEVEGESGLFKVRRIR